MKDLEIAQEKASEIETLVEESILKPVAQNTEVNARILSLYKEIYNLGFKPKTIRKLCVPLDGDVGKSTVEVSITLFELEELPVC